MVMIAWSPCSIALSLIATIPRLQQPDHAWNQGRVEPSCPGQLTSRDGDPSHVDGRFMSCGVEMALCTRALRSTCVVGSRNTRGRGAKARNLFEAGGRSISCFEESLVPVVLR